MGLFLIYFLTLGVLVSITCLGLKIRARNAERRKLFSQRLKEDPTFWEDHLRYSMEEDFNILNDLIGKTYAFNVKDPTGFLEEMMREAIKEAEEKKAKQARLPFDVESTAIDLPVDPYGFYSDPHSLRTGISYKILKNLQDTEGVFLDTFDAEVGWSTLFRLYHPARPGHQLRWRVTHRDQYADPNVKEKMLMRMAIEVWPLFSSYKQPLLTVTTSDVTT